MLSTSKSPLALGPLLLAGLTLVDASLYPRSNSTTQGTFTPEAFISAPRRGAGLPNEAGTLAIYSSNTYNFTKASRSYGTYVLNLADGTSTQWTNSSAVSDPNWLTGNKIVYLQGEDDGTTSILVGDVTIPGKGTLAGTVPGPISGLKATSIGNGTWGIAFSGSAYQNGSIYNPELAKKPLSTGRQYTSLFVRHWDTWTTKERNSVWYAALSTTSNGTYSISKPVNALNGTGLESPIPPFGGTDNYDISKYGLVFIAKDPKLNQANTTKSDVYYVSLRSFTEAAATPKIVTTEGLQGASSVVIFSPVGPNIIFARQKGISYESDKNRLIHVPDVTAGLEGQEFYKSGDGKGSWDRSAALLAWSADGKTIYVEADDFARGRVWSIPANATTTELPKLIHAEGTVADIRPLKDGRVFVSGSSLTENSFYNFIDPVAAAASNATQGITSISLNLNNGARWGLSKTQISEFFYPGAGAKGDDPFYVHAWVIKPSFFDPAKTYPLAFFIHGGPQGAWFDSWSTRWNPVLFAEQGYVVVAFNPTGSTSFGQWLTDHITNNWGSWPYADLASGFEYIKNNLPYVDTDRAVALGASYGGFMVNWIQGQPLGRKFKALFTHDGVFDTSAMYATEELWFVNHDFNGTQFDARSNYLRWNPADHTQNWATPHLIVHNELDYRLPVSEGLAAFNVLQSRGVESKLLSFPDENHWVLKPQNSLVWHKAVLDWINTRVGLPAYSKESDEAYRATLWNGPWIA